MLRMQLKHSVLRTASDFASLAAVAQHLLEHADNGQPCRHKDAKVQQRANASLLSLIGWHRSERGRTMGGARRKRRDSSRPPCASPETGTAVRERGDRRVPRFKGDGGVVQ